MVDLKKYFDKIYCINLDRRPDRYEKFISEISKFGITDIERYSGVDGNTIVNDSPLLNGELGVLTTHMGIIDRCIDDGIKSVLILEDDVVFTEELRKLDEYMMAVPNNWDMIYFGGNHIYGKPPLKINDKVIKLNFTVAIHCVAIKNTIFETIQAVLPHKKKAVDTYYAQLQNGYNAYGFYPNMAKQSIGYSDIQNRIVDYNGFFQDIQ
jgi:hypothetical protein